LRHTRSKGQKDFRPENLNQAKDSEATSCCQRRSEGDSLKGRKSVQRFEQFVAP